MVVRGLRLAMRYLNVAEKNDAAKNIAGHLSKGTARRREGLSTYNKIYEFEANVFGQKSTMTMTSVSGHLLGYEFVGSYKVWQSCNPLALFDAPVVKACSEDYQKIKQTLERETRGCQGLIIWTDCDREGENIGFEIIQVCSQIKSNLKIYRAKFSEITAASVERALRTLGAPDKNVSDAVDVRQELDLRIGAAFTRFQTLRLQKVFPAQLASSLVSYGSCQFPTLGFVVERYRAVESFVPENFWKIAVSHTLNDLTVEFSWKRNRLFDEQACIVIHDMCVENPTATVKSVKSKPKSKWRPLPLDTIEMEKLGSRKLRINAKEVMKIAEKLYTQGIISYPRTETNIYPKELDLNNLVNIQSEDSEWGSFAKRIMDSGGATPRQGKKSDQAHPPIHPTKHVTSKYPLWKNLSGNEKRVYELIVRSFLACCYKDAQGQETTVDIEIAGEKFGASGLMILARNYLDVYPYDKWSAKEIHIYEEGQMFTPTTLDVASGQTTAPALLTEADLIALMEKHGIGTDATHADHIETIKNRSYVALADNIHFVPGLLGMGLVEGYDSMGLSFSKPNLRAGLEADLKEVCEGRKSPQDVLSQQIATYRNVYITVSQEALKIDRALSERFNQQPQNESSNTPSYSPSVMKCNKCRSDMTLRTKKDNQGYFVSCMSYPQCKNAIWFPAIVETVSVTEETCQTCGPSYLKLKFVWKNRSLEHLYPSPFISCIGGCDPNFLQSLSINNAVRSIPSQTTNHSDSGFGNDSRLSQSTVSSSNTNLSNQRTTQNNYNAARSNSQPSSQNNRNNQAGSFRNDFFNGTNNSSSTNYNNQRNQNSNSNQNPSTDDNHVVCNCGEPALLLTVRKSSPNMGRQFYKCPKPNGGCNFFLWATSEESGVETDSTNRNTGWGNATQNNWGSNSNSVADPGGGRSDTDIPQCHCNQPSKKITVSKEGPNKGRCFFGCSNSIANRCKFFQWADDQNNSVDSQPSTSWSSTTTSGGNSRGQESRRGGRPTGERGRATGERGRATGERARKRCGNCREEGHMRNKCPRLQ